MSKTIAAFGTWTSPLDPSGLYARPATPSWPMSVSGRLYWTTERSADGGRHVLVCRDGTGEEREITPRGFDLRTRVHEYGGRCHWIDRDVVYFNNRGDARLYVQPLTARAAPRPLTPPPASPFGAVTGYADLTTTPDGEWVIAVCERLREGMEPAAAIVAVAAAPGGDVDTPTVLVEGRDFLAAPAVSPCGHYLAWLEWDHPFMPWDESRIVIAHLQRDDGTIRTHTPQTVAGGTGRSACAPAFLANGTLVFALDGAGDDAGRWWNLYAWDTQGLRRVTADSADYGAPHWIFGERRWVEQSPGQLLAARTQGPCDELVQIAVGDGRARAVTGSAVPVSGVFGELSVAADDSGDVVVSAGSATDETVIAAVAANGVMRTHRHNAAAPLVEGNISRPQAVSFATRDGGVAHANFYPPLNAGVRGPDDERPPLLVLVHGGPTARATVGLDLRRQYWTTRGFAVIDVNHRGSTGFGRDYRQHLLGRWGIVDVDDVIDAIDWAAAAGHADPDRVFIRGGSAGGYVVLCALTRYPERFSAGACYYGIGNLATLARTTHKFESRYADALVGETFDESRASKADSPWYARSPLYHIERLRTPMILFHGRDDRVVPAELSREMAQALAARGIEHEHIEYPDEGHGFRRQETRVDALERETAFFRRLLIRTDRAGRHSE